MSCYVMTYNVMLCMYVTSYYATIGMIWNVIYVMLCRVKPYYRLYYTNNDAWWKPWWVRCIHVSYVYYDMSKRKKWNSHGTSCIYVSYVHHDTFPLCYVNTYVYFRYVMLCFKGNVSLCMCLHYLTQATCYLYILGKDKAPLHMWQWFWNGHES